MPYLAGYITPQDYGAAGDGVTDDTAEINSALTAAASTGATVLLPANTFLISSPLTVPSNVVLAGFQGLRVQNVGDAAPTASLLKLSAGFTGNGAIVLAAGTSGQRIRQINIDGSAASGSIAGIYATGYVHDVFPEEVHLYKLPGDGVHLAIASSQFPYSWTMTSVTANGCGGVGFNLGNTTDTTLISCQAIGCGGNGFTMVNCSSTMLHACRAEYCQVGYSISGSWSNGNGAGGILLSGCSTDRNISHGALVNLTTSNVPVNFVGMNFRRDGSNGSDYGVYVNSSTAPVVLDGITVFPGTNDDGTGTASPVTGVQVTGSSHVQLNSSFIQGITNAVVDGGSNTFFLQAPNNITATGSTSSPTYPAALSWTTPVALDVTTQALGLPVPRNHGLVAWTGDPTTVPTGDSGLTAGSIYLVSLQVNRSKTLTGLTWSIATAGSGATASQNFVGLYSASGTRLASVGVDARVTTTGAFTETISVAVTPGLYWVAFLFNATGMPQVARHDALFAGLINLGETTTSFRCATNATVQTSLPSSITIGSNTSNVHPLFAALG
jgi:hypothetical protein